MFEARERDSGVDACACKIVAERRPGEKSASFSRAVRDGWARLSPRVYAGTVELAFAAATDALLKETVGHR